MSQIQRTSGHQTKKGFTLIEVLLFLAISTLIVVALMTGITTTVARQRYNDTVQDFVQFLRQQYSDVITTSNSRGITDETCSNYGIVRNRLISAQDTIFTGANVLPLTVKNALANLPTLDNDGDGRGRSDCVIFGKLILFGRTDQSVNSELGNGVVVYDVIGTDITDDVAKQPGITDRYSYIVAVPALLDGTCGMGTPAAVKQYSLNWQAWISTTDATPTNLKAAMLIARSPKSGTVHTFIAQYDNQNYVDKISNGVSADGLNCYFDGSGRPLWELLGTGTSPLSLTQPLDMCISSEDTFAVSGRRRMIRIQANGRNGTAVELLPADSGDNLCL